MQSLPSGRISNGTAFNNQLLNTHCMLAAAKAQEKESYLVPSQGAHLMREREDRHIQLMTVCSKI